jgi:hypothetical protein
MSFVIAGCALLLALLASIVLDDVSASDSQKARRDVPLFGAI